MDKRTLALAAVGGAAVAAVFYAFDPATAGFFPKCLIHAATGLFCPGCGGQRALHALLHGDVPGALGHNALLTVAAPFLAVALVRRAAGPSARRPAGTLSPVATAALVGLAVAFTVLRNLPLAPFDGLAPGGP